MVVHLKVHAFKVAYVFNEAEGGGSQGLMPVWVNFGSSSTVRDVSKSKTNKKSNLKKGSFKLTVAGYRLSLARESQQPEPEVADCWESEASRECLHTQ